VNGKIPATNPEIVNGPEIVTEIVNGNQTGGGGTKKGVIIFLGIATLIANSLLPY
jgi:hypothetical protein